MKNFEVIPAIDLMDGRCVRLTKGDYSTEKVYSSDPVDMARRFEDAGARRLHLVDLDGAKAASPKNLPVLERIVGATGLEVEFGGGIKSREALEEVFGAGAAYAICGSIAVTEPAKFKEWLAAFPGRIILGLDLKNGLAAVSGWTGTVPMSAVQVLEEYDGLVGQAIITEISRDGMLQGVDADFYAGLQWQFPSTGIIVSGGISGYDDLVELKDRDLKAAIVGKAIYEGRINLEGLFR